MKKYIIISSMLLCSLFSFAQEGFVTTGGDASTVDVGSVSYSVGQLAYSSYSSASGLIIEGIQQPDILSNVPISLLYFSAKAGEDRTVLLKWSTVSENNNDYFTIERSIDGVVFEGINKIPSAGNSNSRQDYAVIDAHPFDGYSYYRLKQTDKDGKFTYSQIEKVYLGDQAFSATVSPNPTRDMVQLNIDGIIKKGWNYILVDMVGKKLANGIITTNTTSIDLRNRAQGTYILQVINNGKMVQSFKIIKTN